MHFFDSSVILSRVSVLAPWSLDEEGNEDWRTVGLRVAGVSLGEVHDFVGFGVDEDGSCQSDGSPVIAVRVVRPVARVLGQLSRLTRLTFRLHLTQSVQFIANQMQR